MPAVCSISASLPSPRRYDLRFRSSNWSELLNVRPRLEAEVSKKVGFLDELKVMVGLISNSGVALGIWLLWFLFLLFIELLVLFSKVGDKANDYERTVLHHMNIQLKKLDVLEKLADRN